MSSPLITADEIIALQPCWLNEPGGEARIRRLVGPGVTAAQIAASTDVTIGHRRWLLCHLLARGRYASRERLARWAAGCAIDAARRIGDEHVKAVSIACAETVIRWSFGQASIEEVQRARAAAAAAAAAAFAAAAAAAADAADAASAAAYADDAAVPDAAVDFYAYSAASAHLRELAAIIDALREGREL